MDKLFYYTKRRSKEGVMIVTPRFKKIKPSKLNDDTVICTLQDLIDLLGEEAGLNLYAHLISMGKK